MGILPALAALLVFGVIESPDTGGYVNFAAQIRSGTVPTGAALLHSYAEPISLYRISGFPALLAVLEAVFGAGWRLALVFLQMLAQAGVVAATYLTARRLGVMERLAVLAALLPAIGFSVLLQLCVLTDALCDAAITGAAFALILLPGRRGGLAAGLLLAAAMSFREATCFLVLAYVPLALCGKPKWLRVLLVVLPAWCVAGAQVGWNIYRGAGPVLTTSSQIVMVQAVLPLLRAHLPVYDSADKFDQIANATVGQGGYAVIDRFEVLEFSQAGLIAPQIAKVATSRYVGAWERFPLPMLSATVSNFRLEFLAMPFQPIDTVGALMVYARWPRPNFDRVNILWTELRHGSLMAGVWLVLEVACKVIGTAIGCCGIAGPWIVGGGDRRLQALWCVPAGLVGLYLPVHIETRYIAPAVPIICVMAAAAIWRERIF